MKISSRFLPLRFEQMFKQSKFQVNGAKDVRDPKWWNIGKARFRFCFLAKLRFNVAKSVQNFQVIRLAHLIGQLWSTSTSSQCEISVDFEVTLIGGP